MPARIKQVQLRSGNSIDASQHLTVIVGPNNVGKSVLLGSVWQLISFDPNVQYGPVPVVSQVDLTLPSEEEIHSRLCLNAELRPPGQYEDGIYYEEHYYGRTAGVIPGRRLQEFCRPGLRLSAWDFWRNA